MPVRRFDGIDDYIRCSIGTAASGAITMAALIRPVGANSLKTIMGMHNSGGAGAGYTMGTDGSNLIGSYNGSAFGSAAAKLDTYEGKWVLVALNKASGSAKWGIHVWDAAAKSWVHEESAGTYANAGSVTSGTQRFGAYEAEEYFSGDIAAWAVWNSKRTTEQIEAMATAADTKFGWKALSPATLITFEQASVEETLVDLTGNGANQSARNGTEVIFEEPPIPYVRRSLTLLGAGR